MSKRINSFDLNNSKINSSQKLNNNDIPKIPFKDFFSNALQSESADETKGIEYNFNYKNKNIDENELIAQGVDPDRIEEVFRDAEREREQAIEQQLDENERDFLDTQRLDVTPFQFFIDKAIEVLESISTLDYRVNDLTEKYIRGEVSVDEVSVETLKLNLAVSFVTTILSSGTQAFKEITQLAI